MAADFIVHVLALIVNNLHKTPQIIHVVSLLQCRYAWTSWRLKLPAIRLFVQQILHTNNNDNIKVPHYLRFVWEESDGDQWIPLTKGQ